MQEQGEVFQENIVQCDIASELKRSYLEYAMSVIVGRALPDVRDGLKPVHRRILFTMNEMSNDYNKPYKKSARVVGDVMGKYHPHGDAAIYDSIVRMAQDFSMRYLLVDGQGNFGSVDGDPPAAMRYTEIRLKKISHEIMADIDKETVDFSPNYDNSLSEPDVLPSKIPNLLINGSSGIAVGMATNIPPHNFGEVIDALIEMIKNPDITINEITQIIKGPDFPTGAFICGTGGIISAYHTGRGSVKMRARSDIETLKGGREQIVITEIPYQVNKAELIEKIADLVKNKKIEGIGEVRDESDRQGMRVVIELKKEGVPKVIMNHLYKHTSLEKNFGIIMLAIVDGKPELLNIKSALYNFIEHRKVIVTRRTAYDLRKAKERAHILEGLTIAVDNLDEVVSLIRNSANPPEAKQGLITRFNLSEIQAQAILDMRLQRLTGLEREKIHAEYEQILKDIAGLEEILANENLVLDIIQNELIAMREEYSDERKTELIGDPEEINIEDLIAEEDMVVTLSHTGYIKRNSETLYKSQKRGGKGITGHSSMDDEFISNIFVASTHDYMLCLTNFGKLYWLKVHEIPQAGRTSKGKSIVNLIPIDKEKGEKLTTIVPVRTFDQDKFLVMVTKNGTIKKTSLEDFSRPRPSGIIAANINEGDELIGADITDGTTEIFLATQKGLSIRFPENDVRSMGRTAAGVRGIDLADDDNVVGMVIISKEKDGEILAITANGYGKRTPINAYRSQSRAGKGVINLKITGKVGDVLGILYVNEHDEVMLIGTGNKIIRISVKGIRSSGRSTQGVRLINLGETEKLAAIALLVEKDEEEPSGEDEDIKNQDEGIKKSKKTPELFPEDDEEEQD
jgi:DNA gyrase subunit A